MTSKTPYSNIFEKGKTNMEKEKLDEAENAITELVDREVTK